MRVTTARWRPSARHSGIGHAAFVLAIAAFRRRDLRALWRDAPPAWAMRMSPSCTPSPTPSGMSPCFEVVVEEPTIEQHTMIMLAPREEAGEYIVKMTSLGHARATPGMHRAVEAVGEYVAGLDEGGAGAWSGSCGGSPHVAIFQPHPPAPVPPLNPPVRRGASSELGKGSFPGEVVSFAETGRNGRGLRPMHCGILPMGKRASARVWGRKAGGIGIGGLGTFFRQRLAGVREKGAVGHVVRIAGFFQPLPRPLWVWGDWMVAREGRVIHHRGREATQRAQRDCLQCHS